MLFATHYAALTAEVAGNARVALGYMAAIVGDAEGNGSGTRSITFLYQKRSGVCPSRSVFVSVLYPCTVVCYQVDKVISLMQRRSRLTAAAADCAALRCFGHRGSIVDL